MHEPHRTPFEHSISRRTIVRTGMRLAYAAPLVSATYGLTSLRVGATNAISSDADLNAAEDAAKKNTPPVAVPGEGFEVVDTDGDGFETVTVDGSASSDPDGSIVAYLWTLKETWLSSDAVATVTLPVGTHRLLLTVTDNKGATDAAKIRIKVNKGEAPAKQEVEPTPTPSLPPAPYDLKAKQKKAEVALTWKTKPGTPIPYRIYRTIDDGLNRPIDELDWVFIYEEWEKLSYRDANVAPDVPYLYVVRSFDGVNESERSKVVAITLEPVEEPAVVNEQPVVVEEQPVNEKVAPTEVPTEEPIVEPPPVEDVTPAEEVPTAEETA